MVDRARLESGSTCEGTGSSNLPLSAIANFSIFPCVKLVEMPNELLERLDQWKRLFDPARVAELQTLLTNLGGEKFAGARDLILLHETLLFLRAYPASEAEARISDEILYSFDRRIPADLDPFEDPEVSGIAGTSVTATFSYEVARWLAALEPRNVEIAWDRYDDPDRLGSGLRKLLPMLHEDWPVEAHVPYPQWVSAAHPRRQSDLGWLLSRVQDADTYDSMQIPVTWRIGSSRYSRSRLRLPVRKLYLHREPLLKRSDISLERELANPPLTISRLDRPQARRILDLIVATSAIRYRELYGFSHPDEGGVYHTHAGRGVDIYFFGVPPEWRLPLRAYHGGMFFKNGVPAGYVELLSFFERAEVGFNLYYTFREGESAWLYARLLRLFHQILGVTCFSVDPYQIGHENSEAIASGAFWFYRKLGFRPTEPEVASLVAREERRMSKTHGYRSSKSTLERLADGYILYEIPGTATGEWDGFRIRTLAQRLQGGGAAERKAIAQLARAKAHGPETRYLRWMQGQKSLREQLIRWGTT